MARGFKYEELTSKVIGCAMTVHRALGNGFQEAIYQRALGIELTFNQIKYQREFTMPIFYRGESVGTRRVDFLINGHISVEIKALVIRKCSLCPSIELPRSLQSRNRSAA